MKKIIFTLISVFMFVGCVNNINDIEEPAPVEPTPIENEEEESPELESNQFNCEGIDWEEIQKVERSDINVVLDGYDKTSGGYYIIPYLWYFTNEEQFRIQFECKPIFIINHENNIATITYTNYIDAKYKENNSSIKKVSYDKESNTLTIELEHK